MDCWDVIGEKGLSLCSPSGGKFIAGMYNKKYTGYLNLKIKKKNIWLKVIKIPIKDGYKWWMHNVNYNKKLSKFTE